MIRRFVLAVIAPAVLVLAACTGGQETSAEMLEEAQQKEAEQASIDAQKRLGELGSSLPLYGGARFREDFTRRDAVMIQNQYGDRSEVITLASDDALPKVWHYYVTYLAQYRAWDPVSPFPPEDENWRTLEVNLSEAMQDPFIPGTQLKAIDRKVILQITETEAEPPTIIRYIVTPSQVALAQ